MNQMVESKEMEMPTPLIFTDNAVKKVKALIEEEGQPELKLRVFVSGVDVQVFNMDLHLKKLRMKMTRK